MIRVEGLWVWLYEHVLPLLWFRCSGFGLIWQIMLKVCMYA